MATRMKRVTQTDTKRRIATQSKKTRRQLVNLREQIDRWKDFSLENKCKHDGEVARMLLDSYKHSQCVTVPGPSPSKKAPARQSTLKVSHVPTPSPSSTYTPREPNMLIPGTPEVSRVLEQHSIDNSRSVIHNLVMECETISENSTQGERVNNSKTANGMLVNFSCIYGLPLNLPFKLRYPSEALDRVLESKVYIIVEQSTVRDSALSQLNPIQIKVNGAIEEVFSRKMCSNSFCQTIQPGNINSSIDKNDNIGRENEILKTNVTMGQNKAVCASHLGSNREFLNTNVTERQHEAADISHLGSNREFLNTNVTERQHEAADKSNLGSNMEFLNTNVTERQHEAADKSHLGSNREFLNTNVTERQHEAADKSNLGSNREILKTNVTERHDEAADISNLGSNREILKTYITERQNEATDISNLGSNKEILKTIVTERHNEATDDSNLGSSREILKTNVTERQNEAADVFQHQVTGNENSDLKSDIPEETRNDKFEIVSDILTSVCDRAVENIHSDIPSGQNMKPKSTKRKGFDDICKTNRKEKLLKIDDSLESNLLHSSRMRSKGYRINYAQLDDFDYEISTTDEEVSDSDKKSLLATDNDLDNDSITVKSKVKKKEEDSDFVPELEEYTFSQKHSQKYSKKHSQHSSGSTIDLMESESIETVSDKSLENDNKRLSRLLEKSKRIKVTLSEHKDKYFIEEHMSVERKDRGKKDSEKTYKLLVCAECRKFRTENKFQMEKHLEYHVNGDFLCKDCDFIGTSMSEINMHKSEHRKAKKRRKTYLCFLCMERYYKQEQYQEHLVAVHKLNPWLCTICSTKKKPVTYKDQDIYKQHYLDNHKGQMTQCCSCGLLCLDRTDLRLHVCIGKERKKDISTTAYCDICGKEMTSKSLNNHKRTVHFNVRPYPCSQCSYASRSQLQLTCHVNAKHEGIHNYKCEECDFTCVRAYQLVSHKRTHTGDKPYKCDQCPYAAAWNVQLKQHKKLHGGALGKHCKECGVVVKMGAAFTKHMKKEHGEDE